MQDNTRAEESKQLLLKVSQYYVILPAGVWLGLSHAGNLNVYDAGQMHVGYSEPAGLRLHLRRRGRGTARRLCLHAPLFVLSTLAKTLKIEFYKNTYPMHCITMCLL